MSKTKRPSTVRSTSTKDANRWQRLPLFGKALACGILILVLITLGTIGYYKYHENDLKAQARGVTHVYNAAQGINVSMCKRSQGDVAAVRVYFIANNTTERPQTRVKVYDFSKGGYQGDVRNSGWLFGVMYTTVFAKTNALVNASYPGYSSKLYPITSLQDCP